MKEKTSTEHAIDFVEQSNFSNQLRKILLFTLNTLKKRNIEIQCLKIYGPESVTVVLPLTSKIVEIDLSFFRGLYTESNKGKLYISCGPSTFPANQGEVLSYLEWLDKHMPRNGMTNRDIIEAGNPENLHVPQ